jgi:hypothetical protein
MRGVLAALLVGCYAPVLPGGAPCPEGICPIGLVCSPASRTCERHSIDAAVADAMVDGPDARTSPYRYVRRITIQNAAAAALPAGFTIRVPLGQTLAALVQDGKVKNDLSDLRVIGDGAVGERDRIVDPASGPSPAAVSFSLQATILAGATSTDYALYYGAPDAAAPPASGTAVFAVYDDFTSGISGIWSRNDGPITSGGKLVLRAGHTDALVTNAASDGLPVVSAIELLASVADPNSRPTNPPEGVSYYWFGYQRSGDFSATPPWILWIARGAGQVRAEQRSPVGCEGECDGPVAAQDATAHYFAIERDPNATRFYRDGALSFTVAVTNQADYGVMVRNYLATSDVQFDWIRARARVTPDPTVSLGPEQNL